MILISYFPSQVVMDMGLGRYVIKSVFYEHMSTRARIDMDDKSSQIDENWAKVWSIHLWPISPWLTFVRYHSSQ